MPPTVEDRLRDILEAISDVQSLMQGVGFEQFTSDRHKRLLIERLLEIVCEESRTVPDDIKREGPDIDWRKMIDFGNVLRHAYHSTEIELVWDIVQNRLPPLKSFAERRVRSAGRSPGEAT
jgi:uncharacterized protein with HEPN domain